MYVVVGYGAVVLTLIVQGDFLKHLLEIQMTLNNSFIGLMIRTLKRWKTSRVPL